MMIGMFKTKPEYVQGVKLQNDKISIIETLVFLGEAIDYTDLLVKVGKVQDEGVLRTHFYGDINFGDVVIKNKKKALCRFCDMERKKKCLMLRVRRSGCNDR